ncbi:hypothetical protein [Conchiformibius steedae]|uniref:Uncharacterized protein n=1 Tax=Conchiformibius steedae TaxID=153493 RepID=A0A3P2A7R8_9NEIS|nr:hypothetical protein [Conchiformibius steedae]RRD89663.1 hypothetical protein EII21_07885 [Conchiformibius steedae]
MPAIKYPSLLITLFLLPLSAPAKVVIAGGFMPVCHQRTYTETGNPDLKRYQIHETETVISVHPEYSPPANMQTVQQWLLTQAQALLADAPAATSPLRPIIPPKMADDLACRDRAKLLLQTLRNAAAENRRHMGDKHYIPYDIQEFFTHLQSDDKLMKMMSSYIL